MTPVNFEEIFTPDAIQTVVERLKSDPVFRAEAMADLNAAVEAHYGVTLPQPMKLIQDASGFHAIPAEGSEELSDDELDLVAGGARAPGFSVKQG
ncbi:hypothetical protein [Telmatospirillum sp. J64-1]|uniref:hypothetical protein n=1 Tax=Telmatospirillum sp. J64-1 TaxID=2502183 RepID=UPI00115F1741|nr:hypothetical protein [Telmatospirillum sp. J64-1]